MSTVPLKDLAEFINGFAFKPSHWENDGLRIIRIQNLTDSKKTYNRTNGKFPDKYKVNKGDVLVSWSATLDVFEWQIDEEAWLNQHIFKVSFNEEKVDKTYFKYALKSSIEKMKQFTHGSTMKHIVREDFLRHQIPLPTIQKQKEIVTLINQAEVLIQKRKHSLDLLNEYLRSSFIEMFGDPVTNSKNWRLRKFSEVGTLERGKSKHRPRNAPELLGGKYPLIQTGDVANSEGYITEFNQTYSELGLKQSRMWPIGTLCVTIAANIAKTGILTFEACFPDSIVGFTPNDKVKTEYVQAWISFLQKILEEKAPESAQKNINLEILKNLDIPVPPIQLQNKFVEIVEQTENTKKKMMKQSEELDVLFQSLLQKSFSSN